jgi:hypothetical protein
MSIGWQNFGTQIRSAKQPPTRPGVESVNERVLSSSHNLSSSHSGGFSGLLGSLGGGSIGVGALALTVDVVILLARRVDRDLNGDLTTLDLLAVHLLTSLLLELLGAECDETETTALAGLTASLQLLDHEAGNRAKGDLGLGGRVVLEDLKELKKTSVSYMGANLRNNILCPPSGRKGGWQP